MSGTKSTLQELRELNVRRQRETTVPPPELETDNMTSHITDNMTIQEESNTGILPSVRKVSHKASKPARKADDRPARQPSIKEAIKAAVQGGGGQAKPVLKTVTIKLSPELDKRVEDHCHATGRLKQDVIRDGLLLYFEAVEGDDA